MIASVGYLFPVVVLSAGIVSALATAALYCHLQRRGVRQGAREDTPQTHQRKGSVPSMGGLAIMTSVVVVGLFWAYWLGALGPRLYLVLGAAIAYALVGFTDDVEKVSSGRSTGWRARYKIVIEVLLAALFAVALVSAAGAGVGCSHAMPPWLWIPFVMFVLVGGANAVNLTDGLDGLAAGLSCIAGLAMAVILALLQDYQMSLAAAAVAGAAAGFLWLNAHPARIFMGDIGSLGLGAALSAIAIAAGIEVLFAIIAAVFVWETLSVIIQVAYFKRTKGKRVFKMSPFHHHLELSGWAEPTVVIRLWLVGAVCALAAITIAFASVGTAGVRDLFR